jgi:hypothetical protein
LICGFVRLWARCLTATVSAATLHNKGDDMTETTEKEAYTDTMAWANYEIRRLIELYGPRVPGSDAEWLAQQDMATLMKDWADNIAVEGFPVHRYAFMGMIPISMLLTMAASVLFWLGYVAIGLGVVLAAAIPLVLESVLFRQFADPLFKAYPSHNIIATRNARAQTPKKRLYFVAHADSQFELRLHYRLGSGGMKLLLSIGVLGMVVCGIANGLELLAFHVLKLPDEGAMHWLFFGTGIALFCLFPCFADLLFFRSRRRSAPGASDNLSGCFTAMSVLREMHRRDMRFEDTEVVVLLTGSQEVGLRGAKAFVKRHRESLRDPNVETVVIALDTFRDLKDFAIYHRDLSGTVRHSAKARELVKEAGYACGMDLPGTSLYVGATDAAAFTKKKIHATTFSAVDPALPQYRHTRLDDALQMEPEAIRVAAEIIFAAAERFSAAPAAGSAPTAQLPLAGSDSI